MGDKIRLIIDWSGMAMNDHHASIIWRKYLLLAFWTVDRALRAPLHNFNDILNSYKTRWSILAAGWIAVRKDIWCNKVKIT